MILLVQSTGAEGDIREVYKYMFRFYKNGARTQQAYYVNIIAWDAVMLQSDWSRFHQVIILHYIGHTMHD